MAWEQGEVQVRMSEGERVREQGGPISQTVIESERMLRETVWSQASV